METHPILLSLVLIPHYPQLRSCRFQNHIRHTIADALLRLFDHMAVNICGGGHMRMTEAMADAHAVDPIKEQHARLRVTERMWVDVRQSMTLAEFRQQFHSLVRINDAPKCSAFNSFDDPTNNLYKIFTVFLTVFFTGRVYTILAESFQAQSGIISEWRKTI